MDPMEEDDLAGKRSKNENRPHAFGSILIVGVLILWIGKSAFDLSVQTLVGIARSCSDLRWAKFSDFAELVIYFNPNFKVVIWTCLIFGVAVLLWLTRAFWSILLDMIPALGFMSKFFIEIQTAEINKNWRFVLTPLVWLVYLFAFVYLSIVIFWEWLIGDLKSPKSPD